jgi:hypothetical protein
MAGKIECTYFMANKGTHVDVAPKLARYGSPGYGWRTVLHLETRLFHGSSHPRRMPIHFAVSVLFVSLLSVAPWV